jgi:hypothetical protein
VIVCEYDDANKDLTAPDLIITIASPTEPVFLHLPIKLLVPPAIVVSPTLENTKISDQAQQDLVVQ